LKSTFIGCGCNATQDQLRALAVELVEHDFEGVQAVGIDRRRNSRSAISEQNFIDATGSEA